MATLAERLRLQRPRAPTVGLCLGLIIFLGALLTLRLDPDAPEVSRMAAVALLMAIWWVTNALPLAVTALLPLLLFPLLGIQSGNETASVYCNSTIFLFVGGFLLALALERWNLHRRIALLIIRALGGGPARLVLGFMVASAFLSMWISNTATAILMLAIGLAVVRELEARFGEERAATLSLCLLLGIAYSASAGGLATLVGTPPNLVLSRLYPLSFPSESPLTFGQWMLFALPVSLTLLAGIWFILTRVLFPVPPALTLDTDTVEREYRALGPMRREERMVLGIFLLTALLWVFRQDLQVGGWVLPGWSRLLPTASLIDDSTVAIAMSILLFLLPARSGPEEDDTGGRLLEFPVLKEVPWHIVLLFGGGFALADGFQESGLSLSIGESLSRLPTLPIFVQVVIVCLLLTFLTEVTSNTATSQMILPILASQATALEIHPLLLMVPATLSASCAFMMPVATPPNAIVFGSGRIPIQAMVRTGIVLNFLGVVVISLSFLTWGRLVFSI